VVEDEGKELRVGVAYSFILHMLGFRTEQER
jgi:hypothetical protein